MKGQKHRAAVVGATGYAGAEIVRLLSAHPCIEPAWVTSSRKAGASLDEECPWLHTGLTLTSFDPDVEADIVFLCQEAGFAAEHVPLLKNHRIVDLSADFRLEDGDIYTKVYKKPWPGSAPYGLPELVDRSLLEGAALVANPGCFATAAALAVAPIAAQDLHDGIPVVDAKSGVSGAGRSKTDTYYTFAELYGNLRPYAETGHRHIPEVEQLIGLPIRFTPHIIPVSRGIEVTAHIPLRKGATEKMIKEAFTAAYAGERFIKLTQVQPAIKQVLGSNRCDICVSYDAHTHFAVVTAVIDNLVKGASGQAIQNANLMLGLPEGTGLPVNGVWP